MSTSGSSLPTRQARRSKARRRSHRLRFALAVVLTVAVVALVWKVGQVGSGSDAATPATPTTSASAVPTYVAGSTAGALAPGFPTKVIPVATGATVVSSSMQSVGDGSHVQVSLGLRTTKSTKAVLASYADTWKSKGFARGDGKPVKGADASATFRRTTPGASATGKVGKVVLADYLVIAVVSTNGTRLVTITGQVSTPGS